MTQTEDLLTRLPTEMGGLDAGPIQRVEHEYLPWEKRCHALANILDSRKIINTEEKRRGIEDLGSEIVEKLSYYERWIVAFANILFRKEILTPGELARKMDQVQARWPTEAADEHARSTHQ
jgi:Nitrile hydratase beta subunit